MEYIEQDCTFTHDGQEFTSGGAVVTDSLVIGYMSSDMKTVKNWHGDITISSNVKVTASWATPRSFVSSRMYQVRVNVNGHWFTGRTAGGGMIVRLKPCK